MRECYLSELSPIFKKIYYETLSKAIGTKYRSNDPEVFLGKGILKYAANLRVKTHAEVRFQ